MNNARKCRKYNANFKGVYLQQDQPGSWWLNIHYNEGSIGGVISGDYNSDRIKGRVINTHGDVIKDE